MAQADFKINVSYDVSYTLTIMLIISIDCSESTKENP